MWGYRYYWLEPDDGMSAEEEQYIYESDLQALFEAHMRPPEDDDFEEVLR
jgi:hypothetical protein